MRTRSIFSGVQVGVQKIFASPSSSSNLRILFFVFKFEFGKNDQVQRVQVPVCSPGLCRSQWHEQINDMQLSFGKIIITIYTKLYFVVIFYLFSIISF